MTDSAFWRFSLAFYALPDVAQICIALQDDAGADVNVLLYLLFLGQHGRALDAAAIASISALARPWNDAVVAPLRSVRRSLRSSIGSFHTEQSAALRSEVKRIELCAERILQEKLYSALPPPTLGVLVLDRVAAAANNLRGYGASLHLPDALLERLLERFTASLSGTTSN